MTVRNSKKMNFHNIYNHIVKYRKSIPFLAGKYGMEEEAFREKMESALGPKLYLKAIKANEGILKQQRDSSEQVVSTTITTNVIQEKKEMARRNEIRMEQNYRQTQSRKDREIQMQKKQTTKKTVSKPDEMSILEKDKVTINGEISNMEKALDEASQILAIREESVAETQKVFEKASKALAEAKSERDKAKNAVAQHNQSIEALKTKLGNVEAKITELVNKAIYLVAPGYTGEKPVYGTYYSTAVVEGFETLSVKSASVEYAIEPSVKDMMLAGYDSLQEYMDGLRFVMLCMESTYNGMEYTVLVNDERLKRLLQTHVG